MFDEREETAESGSSSRGNTERGSIRSVDRALTLLEAIAEAGGETTLTKLAVRTSLNISTCHHLLSTLVKWGYVAKVPGRRSYALGARIFYLGNACLRQVDLPQRARPLLERINKTTGETVHLAILQRDDIVTVMKLEARHAVRVDTGPLGNAEAAHATALGKAMLAWLPEAQILRVIKARGLQHLTPNTITDLPTLTEELRLIRRNGFAIDREEFQPGVICVGAAIRDHSGAVVGSISCSAPTMRAHDEHLTTMREAVVTAARALSTELGESDPQPGLKLDRRAN
jgi:IclR family acetate operon transcriptional repressor